MPMFLATMFFCIIVQKVSYASKQLIKSQLCNHFGDNVISMFIWPLLHSTIFWEGGGRGNNTSLKIDLDSLNMQTRIEGVAETQLAPLWLVIKNCKNVLYSNDGFFSFFFSFWKLQK